MAEAQQISAMETVRNGLPATIPKFNFKKCRGKRVAFPFAHSETEAEFPLSDLEREGPNEVFRLSYTECTKECAEHEQDLRSLVRTCFEPVADQRNGVLRLRLGEIIFRKQISANRMRTKDVLKETNGRPPRIRMNLRLQYMRNDDAKLVEILERLGAVKKSEKAKSDTLVTEIDFQCFPKTSNIYIVHLDPSTMLLSKVIHRAKLGIRLFMPIPTLPTGTERIFNGMTLESIIQRKFKSEELCGMCHESQDASLLTVLRAPGFGVLSKLQNPDRFLIQESSVNVVSHFFLRHNRVNYYFDLEGVEVVMKSNSGVNHHCEDNQTETFVHQRVPGRDFTLFFRQRGHLPIDSFAATVARVIVTLKNAVHAGDIQMAMYDLIKQRSRRAAREEGHRFPAWRLRRDGESSVIPDDLQKVRDGRNLEEMLGVAAGMHRIPLRAAVRGLLKKIEDLLQEMRLDRDEHQLLKQKLLDAAAEKGLAL